MTHKQHVYPHQKSCSFYTPEDGLVQRAVVKDACQLAHDIGNSEWTQLMFIRLHCSTGFFIDSGVLLVLSDVAANKGRLYIRVQTFLGTDFCIWYIGGTTAGDYFLRQIPFHNFSWPATFAHGIQETYITLRHKPDCCCCRHSSRPWTGECAKYSSSQCCLGHGGINRLLHHW